MKTRAPRIRRVALTLTLTLCVAAASVLAACGGAGDRPPPAREWQDPGQARSGEWTLYWNAAPTSDLEPSIAAAYGVERRARGALVNVSLVRDRDPRGSATADVAIAARTLLGEPRTVRVRRVERDGAVSWLGELDVRNREMLLFTVSARIPGQPAPIVAEFRREFYVAE